MPALSRLYQRHREGVRFCLRFALYTLGAYLVLSALYDELVLPFTRLIAWLTVALLKAAGGQAWVSEAVVGVPHFSVEIKNNCNAIYEIGLYTAAVWAYPASVRARLTGTVLGAGVLYAVNLGRVLSLLALGRAWPWGFEVAHTYVWQALFLAVVAVCWVGWVSRVRPVG